MTIRKKRPVRFIDLFCGIGGFRIAAESFGWKCVFSCDIDKEAARAYKENFGDNPLCDIRNVSSAEISTHDVLFAGFPCQPFSIIGNGKGFEDIRGTLFFEIARILQEKKPKAFVLENVKRLVRHNKGQTLKRIIAVLRSLSYKVEYGVLNALDFGLPQKRERAFIIGVRNFKNYLELPEPNGICMTPLSEILEKKVPRKYYASKEIQKKRKERHKSAFKPGIWHENKSGNVCSYSYSCALRAGASYNYLLVDGKRRFTPREMLRLQGFPDKFKIVCNDAQTRKQAGNAVPVPVVKAVLSKLQVSLNGRKHATSKVAKGAKGQAALPFK